MKFFLCFKLFYFLKVYLLNEEQRVKVIVRGAVDEVDKFKDHFSE